MVKGLLGKRELVTLLSPVTPSVCLLWFGGGYAIVEKALLFMWLLDCVMPCLVGGLLRRKLVAVHSYVNSNVLPFWCVSSLLKKRERERVDWLDLRCGFLV